MALNSLGLGFLFTAHDQASGVMDKVKAKIKDLEESSGKSLSGLKDNVKKLGVGMAAAAIGVGGLAASYALAKKAAVVETAVAEAGATAQLSAEEMIKLQTEAQKAVRGTTYAQRDAIGAANTLFSAGNNLTDSIKLMIPSLQLAAGSAGALGLAESAETVSQAMAAFGIETKFAQNAVDQMAGSAQIFSMGIGDLPAALSKVSGGAQLLNQSMTESMIAFGLAKAVIGNTEVSATATSAAMGRMVDKDIQAKLKLAKIDVIDRQTKQTRRYLDILLDLRKVMDKKGAAGATWLRDIFGEEGTKAINAQLAKAEQGMQVGDEYVKGLENVTKATRKYLSGLAGSAQEFQNRTTDTFDGTLAKINARGTDIGVAIGEPFKDLWRPVVDGVNTALEGLLDSLQKLDPKTKLAVAGFAMGALKVLLFGGALILLNAAIPFIIPVLGLLTGAIWSFVVAAAVAAIELWPLYLIAIALAAAWYLVSNNIGGLGESWDRFVGMLGSGMSAIGSVFEGIGKFIEPLWESLKGGFSATIEVFAPGFEMLRDAFNTLMDNLSDIGKQFDFLSGGPGSGLLGFFRLLGKAIGWIVNIIALVISGFVWIISGVAWLFAKFFEITKPLRDLILGFLGSLFDTIIKIWEAVSNFFGLAVNKSLSDVQGGKGFGVSKANELAKQFAPAGPKSGKTPAGIPKMPITTEPSAAIAAGSFPMMSSGPPAPMSLPDDYYDKLAKAISSQPLNASIYIDSEKVAAATLRGKAATSARMGGSDTGYSGEYSEG